MKRYFLKTQKELIAFAFVLIILQIGFSFAFSQSASGQRYSPSFRYYIVENQETVCTFNNVKKGALQIVKNVLSGTPETFYYHIVPTPETIAVKADQRVDENEYTSKGKNKDKIILDPGEYTISEALPSFRWNMNKVSCVILPEDCGDEVCDDSLNADGEPKEDCNTCFTDCGACSGTAPPEPPPLCDASDDTSDECHLTELEKEEDEEPENGERENDLTFATSEEGEINLGFHGAINSLWYRFTPKKDQVITIDTCKSNTDTVMALNEVLDEEEDPDDDYPFGLELAFDDDSCPYSDGSKITYEVVKDIEYLIHIEGYGKATGPIIFSFKEGEPPEYEPNEIEEPEGATGERIEGRNAMEKVEVEVGRTTACTFDNTLVNLKIVNQTIGGDGDEKFNYIIRRFDTSSPSVSRNKLSVHSNQIVNEDDMRGDEHRGENGKYFESALTSYLITQEVPEDWSLNAVFCEVEGERGSNGVPTIYSYGISNISIKEGKLTTCTFVNTKRGNLEIIKEAEKADGGEKFSYDINFTTSNIVDPRNRSQYLPPDILETDPPLTQAEIEVDEEGKGNDKIKVHPGSYEILESVPQTEPGKEVWALIQVDCVLDDEDKTFTGTGTYLGWRNVDIFAGHTTTCTYKNTLRPIEGPGSGGRGTPQEEIKETE